MSEGFNFVDVFEKERNILVKDFPAIKAASQ
jgi:hypothetical protein